jgi:hypothetical protein
MYQTNTSLEQARRDWFIGMALQGLLASTTTNDTRFYEEVVKKAFKIADLVIERGNAAEVE